MADIRIAVIDGTGPEGEPYKAAMEDSFCHAIFKRLGEPTCFYQRGPTALGRETMAEGRAAAEWLRRQHAADPSLRLMLAGYSRGGSAAIIAAEILKREGVEIAAMFLFDPVARHTEWNMGEIIPSNVRFSRSVRRSTPLWFVLKYEGSISDASGRAQGLPTMSNPARVSFGNAGVAWEASADPRRPNDHRAPEPFVGSHGALGGVGWKFVEEDEGCQKRVSTYMREEMAKVGLNVALGDGKLGDTPKAYAPPTFLLAGGVIDIAMLAHKAISLKWRSGERRP